MKPYIGVTGIATLAEAKGVLDIFCEANITEKSDHIPMFGILASKRLVGRKKHVLPRHPATKAVVHELISKLHERGLVMVHYELEEQEKGFLPDLLSLLESSLAAGALHAIQLNGAASFDDCLSLKKAYPDVHIVYQLGPARLAGDVMDIAKKMRKYECCDRILIDPSQGKGITWPEDRLCGIYQTLKKALPSVCIGFAGGLNGTNVRERIQTFKTMLGADDFSIDAESGLRDAKDTLDLAKVRRYVEGAQEGFKRAADQS